MNARILTILATAGLLAGCAASQDFNAKKADMIDRAKEEVDHETEVPEPEADRFRKKPYVSPEAIPYRGKEKPDVSLAVSGVSVREAMEQLLDPDGKTVIFGDKADPDRKISLSLKDVTRSQAVQMAARSAGYIAIPKPRKNAVIVAAEATRLFRVPSDVLRGEFSQYAAQSNPSGTGGAGGMGGPGAMGGGPGPGSPGPGGGPGGPGGGAISGGGTQSGAAGSASMSVEGGSQPENPEAIKETLLELAGGQDKARVSIGWRSGLISVHGHAPGVQRVTDWMRTAVREALTQVSIKVAVVRVEESDSLETGLDWQNILDASQDFGVGLSGAANVSDAVIQTTYGQTFDGTITDAGVNAVVKALDSETDSQVLTRPSTVTRNRKPTVLFSGEQRPYLGEIGTSTTGVSGTTQQNASVSYASDGIGIGIQPTVLDDGNLTVRVTPVLSEAGELQTFETEAGTLQAPPMNTQQSYFNVTMASGQTLILGGNTRMNDTQNTEGVPLLADIPVLGKLFGYHSQGEERAQTVFLMQAQVEQPPDYDPVEETSL